MKTVFVSIILLATVFVSSVRAQDQGSVGSGQSAVVTAPNAFYFEALGSGFIYSLNYDRTLMNIFAVRLGFGYFPFPPITETNANGTTSTVNASLTSIPVSFSWFPFNSSTSAPSSKLEIGASAAYINLVAKSVNRRQAVAPIFPEFWVIGISHPMAASCFG